EECFENILSLWIHYGRQPNFSELKHSPSTVGQKAYILRWGGWRAALSAFVKKINKPISSFNEAEHENDSNAFIEHRPETQKNTVIGTLVPRSIPIGMRYNILSRDKFRCVICGSSPAKDLSVELHVDHIHPWSRGGQNIEDNLRTLCSKCNLGKSDKIEDIET
ncbi:MAG: HNH endonuclease, partial [Pseudomonadota bacterium]